MLNTSDIPSIGKMIKVSGDLVSPERISVEPVDQLVRAQAMQEEETRHPVIVGLGAVCLYGLGTCLAGAVGALKKLDGVKTVTTVLAKDENRASVATLYLDHDGLPDLQNWPRQFFEFAKKTYAWRGVEMTLDGTLSSGSQGLILDANAHRPSVLLAPLQQADKIQIDQDKGVANPLPLEEAQAYADLAARAAVQTEGASYSVTGPIKQTHAGYLMNVRTFQPYIEQPITLPLLEPFAPASA
jgi:hypothetical protein